MRALTSFTLSVLGTTILAWNIASADQLKPSVVELTAVQKTAVITVINDSAEQREYLISLGSGSSKDSRDRALVFYPKQMTIQAGESRFIRLGYSGPMPKTEQTLPYTLLKRQPRKSKTEETLMMTREPCRYPFNQKTRSLVSV